MTGIPMTAPKQRPQFPRPARRLDRLTLVELRALSHWPGRIPPGLARAVRAEIARREQIGGQAR